MTPRRTRATTRRLPALDGLRGLAVLAVMAYHAGIGWLPGGLLGVDVFFVLSGFLITYLLADEHRRTARISLRRFWGRRLRRLAPCLIAVVVTVDIVWTLVGDSLYPSLRQDSLFTLGYSSNWWFASSGQGYFEVLQAPSPLLHTWSLAVEEQFYLLWPPVAVLILARGRSVQRSALLGAGVAALATLGGSLAGLSTDTLYYSTVTRAVPLLIGAAAGAWYAGRTPNQRVSLGSASALQVGGLAAAVAVGWAMATVSGTATALYRGGGVLLAAAVVLTILSVVLTPKSFLARLLGSPLLRSVGVISYGLYLWHWPVFLFLTHSRTGLDGVELLGLRFAVTWLFATVSYRCLERPIQLSRFAWPRPALTGPLAGCLAVLLVWSLTAPTAETVNPLADRARFAGSDLDVPPPPTTTAQPATAARGSRVLFVGDSLAFTLSNTTYDDQATYDLHITNAGLLGCGVTRLPRVLAGQSTYPSADCLNWPALRSAQVRQFRPDVVALLVGRWEVTDQLLDGSWRSIGDPTLDAYLDQQLDTAIADLSATGAKVALLTMPCLSEPEAPDGQPYPQDDPVRVQRFNQLLVAAQKRHPAVSTVVDLRAMVCPGGRFTSTLDGIRIRTADGVHFPWAPIEPVTRKLLPQLRRIALEARADPRP